MPTAFVSQDDACSAGERTTEAYVRLLRWASNPGKSAIGDWSVGDTATHTAHVFEMYAQAATGDGSFPVTSTSGMNDHWARRLSEDSDRDPASAADRVEAAAATIWPAYRAKSEDEIVEWYGGVEVPASTPPCIIVTEALVHGFDIARAEGHPWEMDAGVAGTSVRGVFPLLPEYVDRETAGGVSACFELRLRGGPPAYLVFDDGALTVTPSAPRAVDCRLSVDPAAYLLVGYGRIGQWGEVAKGKVLVWGRKPWLGLKLGKLIASP
jgi:uncharacterized protein (TIGR03083 family)